MSPQLTSVEKAGIRGLRVKRNPGNIMAQDFFTETEVLRKEFARLIGANDPKRVVVIPAASYGIASVAKNIQLSRGENIIVAAEQFPSNYYAWQRLAEAAGAHIKIVSPPDDVSSRGKQWNERILEAIDAHTKAVAIGHVHWVDGTRFDLESIRKRTRETGALLIIDGTQSVGAMPFDVQKFQPDALICAGYKWLLGPYSIGLAYYGEYFDQGIPIEENWINRLNSEDFSQLVNYQPQYQEGALRYEVGEHSNPILVPMLLKAVQQINRWGIENIQAYCRHITQPAIETLRANGFWIEGDDYRGSHLFGIRPPKGMDLQRIKDSFIKKNIYVSFRGDAIRVSPHVYNTEQDMKKLVKALSF